MKRGIWLALGVAVFGLLGCSSELAWTNSGAYRTVAFDTSREGLLVLLENASSTEESELLCLQVAQALATRGGYRVRYMAAGNVKADVRLRMSVTAQHRGKVSNIFVSFPGYLIFTQGWLGNGYTVDYDVTCAITNAVTGESIGTVRVPIQMELRHTDVGRSWADCLIWPVAPLSLINGLYCTTYDKDITPQLNTLAYPTLGEHIAAQLIARINVEPGQASAHTPAAPTSRLSKRPILAPTSRTAAPAAKPTPTAKPAPRAAKPASTPAAKPATPAVKPAPAAPAVKPAVLAVKPAAPAPAVPAAASEEARELKSLLDFGIIDQKTYAERLRALQ